MKFSAKIALVLAINRVMLSMTKKIWCQGKACSKRTANKKKTSGTDPPFLKNVLNFFLWKNCNIVFISE